MPMRKAASVFPEPVGAWTSTCPPRAIAGQPSSCAGVGAANARSNHSLVAAENTSSAPTSPRVPTPSYPRPVRYDVVVVGGGTAGCVVAARLSENPDRTVCLVEAGPDYGPLEEGRWPPELLDPQALPSTHLWPEAGEDRRTLGGRVLGGSSSVNACMLVQGTPEDYDEWGGHWTYEGLRPYLERARATLRVAPRNAEAPGPFHAAFADAAREIGFPSLASPDDPATPVGVAPFPANVVEGRRWNAAHAYLDPARNRPNLEIVGDVVVDRVELDDGRATGVVCADGSRIDAGVVLLAAGAYFSPAILLRSGIGPAEELARHGIPPVSALPVGERLLDHYGISVAWALSPSLAEDAAARAREGRLVQPHVLLKAASRTCPPGSWDLHLLSWIYEVDAPPGHEACAIVFHVKPRSHGRVRLRSTDPHEPPLVERGYLADEEDLGTLLEGIDLARRLAATDALGPLLGGEVSPAGVDPAEHVRTTARNYFHPAGTCPLGTVVDTHGRVFGVDGLHVCDASFMPTIPRANTNLTTAAIAERIAENL